MRNLEGQADRVMDETDDVSGALCLCVCVYMSLCASMCLCIRVSLSPCVSVTCIYPSMAPAAPHGKPRCWVSEGVWCIILYVCGYTYTYICLYYTPTLHSFRAVHIHILVHIHIHSYTYTYTCTYIHTYTYTYTFTCTYTYTYTYSYTCTYIAEPAQELLVKFTHTYIRTHTYWLCVFDRKRENTLAR